jgi:hypothetical protein
MAPCGFHCRLEELMSRITWLAAIAAAVPVFASDANDIHSELAQLRAELATLRKTYDTRIAALEARLRDAVAVPTEEVIEPIATSVPSSSKAFNPAVSLILDGKYRSIERDPESYRIGGFFPSGEEAGPGMRNVDLGESELAISANIDPYFAGHFIAAYSGDGETEVEEAYLTHIGLVPGATLEIGRLLSAFGYQNERHAHVWDFVDAPLVMEAFFGGQLKEDGLQLRWLAPTDLFLELGAQLGTGANFPGSHRNRNWPNAAMVFAHVGGDVGTGSSYRIGGSFRHTNAVNRTYDDVDSDGTPVTNAFDGDVDMWGIDAAWKWTPEGNPFERSLELQAEYYSARSVGSLSFDSSGVSLVDGFVSRQSGWYAQAVYGFLPRWRVGVRYDELDSGTPHIGLVGEGLDADDFPLLAENEPSRWTAMIDFSPSEFSRLRLQYARDEARFGDPDDQIFLQYNMSMGAHGAHQF